MRPTQFLFVLVLLIGPGCGAASKPQQGASPPKGGEPEAAQDKKEAAGAKLGPMAGNVRGDKQPAVRGAGEEVEHPLTRKIKYSSELRLVAKDLDETQHTLMKLVTDMNGYVA